MHLYNLARMTANGSAISGMTSRVAASFPS